jgi:hypothetical protein
MKINADSTALLLLNSNLNPWENQFLADPPGQMINILKVVELERAGYSNSSRQHRNTPLN